MKIIAGAKRELHRVLDRFGFSLTRKERSNLDWFYPIPVNCEISQVPFFLEFFFGKRSDGLFIEVGAFDGYNYSNTYGLAIRGWTGYLIEPDPIHYEECRNRYRAYPKITVSNCAISNGAVDRLSLTRGGLITTSSSAQADAYRQTKYFRDMITEETFVADACTLDSHLKNHNVPQEPDVLVVDVEGATADVFSGFSLSTWRPKMLIVELFDLHPTLTATRSADLAVRRHILQNGYETIHRDSINSIFVRTDIADAKSGD
ncbi:MAG: FkbM family methyltransferase [Chthoniobacterales bacterium]